jgi:uncharacterized repeat protein (TIGR04052 family)
VRRLAWIAALLGATLGGGVIGSGCLADQSAPVEIHFAARAGKDPVACDASAASDQQKHGAVLEDLRFYVHDVELVDRTGEVTPVALTDDGVWQNGSVALLDFENGAGSCANGTTAMHAAITGRSAAKEPVGLRFVLGVPFAVNHADPAEASPPLNLGRMHWSWQGGYKFLRFEATTSGGKPLRFHLGSTGCEGSIGHISKCNRPNRAVVQLDGFDPRSSEVVIDVAALENISTADSGLTCMSEASDPGCRAAFAVLGLDLATGDPAPTVKQQLFTVSRS